MKKIFFILFIFFLANLGFAAAKTNVYVFKSEKCPRCQKEKQFLEKIKKNHPDIEIIYLDVVSNKEDQKVYQKAVKELNIAPIGLPTTVIGSKYFVGFINDFTSGTAIEKEIMEAKKNNSQDFVGEIIKKKETDRINQTNLQIPETIKIPVLGEINLKNLSLPALTILLGAIDGFNPCAMWALVMLLSFLIAVKNRKKMFILGGLFIFVSGIVYFLFMIAWLNVFIFLSYVKWIQIAIGLIALGGGSFYLKEFFFNKENVCKAGGSGLKRKISNKLFLLTESNRMYLAVIGIIALAFFVNLIELFCSMGLPVVYTKILSLSSISLFQHYLYVILYIFIFMLDDLLIFSIAFCALRLVNLTSGYLRLSRLIGGVVLLIIGILLIFKPEYLTF